MHKNWHRALAAVMFLVWVTAAPAQEFGVSEGRLAQFNKYANWIVTNSRYSLRPRAAPLVLEVSPQVLMYLGTGNEALARSAEPHGLTVRAAYSRGVMFLPPEGWYVSNQMILHELVHHFQHMDKREFRCQGEQEREAYELQEKWARMHNEVPEVPDPLTLLFMTSCSLGDRQ